MLYLAMENEKMTKSKTIKEGSVYKGGRNSNKPSTPRPQSKPPGQGTNSSNGNQSEQSPSNSD